MPKVIFVLHRKGDLNRDQMNDQWHGEAHTSIVGTIPGLTRWVQNQVKSAPAEPVCDGVGELWFASDDVLNQALQSAEMGAAVEDAKRFLDMNKTGLLIVDEKPVVGGATESTAREQAIEDWGRYWSSHQTDRLLDLFTPDVVYEDVPMAVVNRGKDDLRGFAEGVFGAFPDVTFEVTSLLTNGSRASFEWIMRGTHLGDLPGMPATGKQVDVRGLSVAEFAGRKIRRCCDYWDMATLLKQLGLMAAA